MGKDCELRWQNPDFSDNSGMRAKGKGKIENSNWQNPDDRKFMLK